MELRREVGGCRSIDGKAGNREAKRQKRSRRNSPVNVDQVDHDVHSSLESVSGIKVVHKVSSPVPVNSLELLQLRPNVSIMKIHSLPHHT